MERWLKKMAIKIGIVNQKGGVGKTTTAICLTDAFTQIGYKVLLIDFDPQGNSSKVFQVNENELTIYDAILKKVPLSEIIVKGNAMGDIVPANNKLKLAIGELINAKSRETKLKNAIMSIEKDYDVIIMDSGPSAGIMMDNVLTASNGIIIPMEPETFAIDGLASLLENIGEIQEELNPSLKVYGVLLTKYERKKSVQSNIKEQFKGLDESIVHTFSTTIRNSAAIPKVQGFMNISDVTNLADKKVALSQGSIYNYSANNGADDYREFTAELLEVIGSGK